MLSIANADGIMSGSKPHVPLQVPDLELSQDTLQFGRVEAGKAKVITVQLHNPRSIACEWEVKKPIEVTKAKDWQFFRWVCVLCISAGNAASRVTRSSPL